MIKKIIDIKALSVINLYFVVFLLLSGMMPLWWLYFQSENQFSHQQLSFSLKDSSAEKVLSQYHEQFFKHKQAVEVRVVGEKPPQILQIKFNDSNFSQQIANQIEQQFTEQFNLTHSKTKLILANASGSAMLFSFLVCLMVFGTWYIAQQKKLKSVGSTFAYGRPMAWGDLLELMMLSLIALSVGVLLSRVLSFFGVVLADDVQQLGELGKKEPVILLLIVVVLAPVVEELVFRGMMLKKLLLTKQPPWLSAVLVSCLFATSHLLRPLNGGFVEKSMLFTTLFVLSICCCYAYYRQQKIIAPILVHSLFNVIGIFDLMN